MRRLRRLRFVLVGVLFAVLYACGETPEETTKARGVLSGINVVLALTITFLVVAVGIVVGALVVDRFVRTRRELAEAPDEPVVEEEEQDEVVAGITVGRARVPRWLFGVYVLIPLFALLYVFNNVAIRGPEAEARKPTATKAPTGPVTKATIVAKQIKFDTDHLLLAVGKVTVTFDNADAGVPHTFTVWKSEADAASGNTSGQIATTDTFPGVAKKDVTFTTPGAGKFYFDCIVHPQSMKGILEVAAK